MGKKMVLIINVSGDEVNSHGIKYAFDEAFKGITEVDNIHETFYREDQPLTLTAAAVAQDVEGRFSDEYTEEQLVLISDTVADDDDLNSHIDNSIDYAIDQLGREGEL